MAGCNRSVAIIVAELLASRDVELLEIVRQMRRIRGNWALSNESFQELVVVFARQRGRLGPLPDAATGYPTKSSPRALPRDAFRRLTD